MEGKQVNVGSPDLDAHVVERLAALRARIAATGRDPETVRVVAVTKGFGPDAVIAAVRAGLVDIGENYPDELRAKADAIAGVPEAVQVRWHFQGRIQTNKLTRIAGLVHLWQTVDSERHAAAVARRAPGAAVLVQCNLTGAPERTGCALDEVDDVVGAVRALGLDVQGLMGVGPDADDPALSRRAFTRLRQAADRLALPVRSMGMSDDLEPALAEGATVVRVGSALFGSRP